MGRGQSRPTDGEGRDSATLELTGRQEELVKAVQATGKPTVVVLINGRPLAVRWIAEHVRRDRRGLAAGRTRAGRRWPKSSSATSIPAESFP